MNANAVKYKNFSPIKQLLYILFALLFSLTACIDDEFSVDAGNRLSFSHDTIQFDTVFTTIGTATRQLKVYNRNKEGVRITSIRLANASQSRFYINVDGQRGTHFEQVEIRAKDSIYIFVEANIDPNSGTSPLLVKDSIVFVTNGNTQDVKLCAYGQDVEILRGKVLTEDTHLTASRPYLIYDSLVVAPTSLLTLEAGATLHFYNKSSLIVHGKLHSDGIIGNEVVLRGDRLDNLFVDLPYDLIPGQWQGVHFTRTSVGNEMNYTSVRNAHKAIVIESDNKEEVALTLINTMVHNASGDLFTSVGAKVKATNCTFTNAGGSLLNLTGGNYQFIHCTIANYFSWNMIKSPILNLSNYIKTYGDEESLTLYPLETTFANSIVCGSTSNPLHTDVCEEEAALFEYKFVNCLFSVGGEDDDQFVNTIWEGKPQFLELSPNGSFKYDFRIDSTSMAIDKGDVFHAASYPFDILGNSRIQDGKPDIGAYEYTPSLP